METIKSKLSSIFVVVLWLMLPFALRAEISFGDTYSYFEASWSDGWSEYNMRKVSIDRFYTGSSVQSPSKFSKVKQYVLFEVIGAKSKSDVLPIVENLGFDGTLSASVWTDDELMQKAMPAASTAGAWETDGRSVDNRGNDSSGQCDFDYIEEFLYEYELERSKKDYEWPVGVWPDNKAVAGRYWVAVECNPSASRRWYGLEGSIRVWQSGTDVKSEQFYISYSPDDAWPFAADAKGLFRNFSIDTKFVCLSAEVWGVIRNSYDTPIHSLWVDTSVMQQGAPLKLTLPEAGILYMSSSWGPGLEDITAKNADSQSLNILSWADAWEIYEELGPENIYYKYGAHPTPGCLKIEVNSKKTITLEREDTDDDFDFDRLQFFPKATKAVAIEASYFSIFDNNRYERYDGELGEYLQGYVTGTGVYKIGETVSLTAVPAPGEEFDHWELKYGNFPDDIVTNQQTLSFVVKDACAGTAEERKQMVVKAVWKEKHQLIGTPNDITMGSVTGSGFYHNGENVTITATPYEGYAFAGWFADENCTTPLTENQDYLNSSYQYIVGNGDVMVYAKFVEQQADTLKMDLLHNYAFSEGEGVWYGDEVWKVAMLEDDGLYTNEGDVPWVFEHGAKFYQNGNICIAVTGCGSEKIVPVITLGTASAADNLSATVLTDAEFASKLHIAEYDFEQDDDEFVYEDYAARIGCYYPASAWPNGSVVEGRQWILVSLKDVNIGPDGFFSPKTFAVGIEGTDQKTPVITLCPTDKLPNETTFTPSNVFGLDIMMNGYPNANSEHCSFDPFFELWYGDGDGRVPYVFDVGDPYEDGGDSVRNLTVSVPSGGELYLKMETEYRGGRNTWDGELNRLQISGSAYGGNVRTVGSAWSGPYGSYWVVLTAKSAGNLVIELGDFEKFIVNGIWFRPSSVNEAQCLATEAWYRGSTTVANGRSMSKYLGFVTGSGVITFGEKATLVCHPNKGEALDHWEFINCTAPADATINNRVLTFTVSKSLYDEIADTEEPLKRIVVRPVFRPAGQGGDQSTFIVVFNANGGECAEVLREVEKGGALGALPAPVRDGYQFNGWYTAPVGGTKVAATTKVTGYLECYAQWSASIGLVVADGCEGMGTVSGGGVVAAGKKVTLKATAKKGYVFAGWYDGAGNPLSGGVDYRTATYPYVSTGEPAAITARFVPAEADAAEENIGFAISGTAGVYAAGEAIEQQVTVSSFSMPTVTVTGLPAGLKFDAKTLKITGKPTKPGELATATFTIKNQSNKTGKKETVAYRVGDATSGLLDLKYNTVPGEDGYALIVPGVETDMHGLLGLDPGDLAGWTITGLPAGLKFDSRTGTFSGKATQSGKTYLVTFKKGAEIATITLGTKPDPKLTLTKYLLVRDDIAPEVEDGTYYYDFKLTGGGSYQVGKKVSVSATAPKNWMFVGWASPSDFNSNDNTVRLTMVSTDAKYTFSMPSPGEEADEVELTAVFTHVFGSAIVPDDEIEE